MYCLVVPTLLGSCCAMGQPLRAADDFPQQALAFQKAMQQAIREVEPAIACIVVSRNETYHRFQQPPSSQQAGKLGDFQPDWVEQHLGGLTPEERLSLRKKLDLAHPDHVPESYGSGVVIDEQGLVLTNYHVVRDATKVFVRLPGGGGSYADIHAADPRSDLAVLRLLQRKRPLKALPLGDGGQVERGQFVLSIAHLFAAGFRDGQPSASWGIISNLRRRAPASAKREEELNKTLHHYGTLLQTDARLHLGCSGGALINLRGELIGLTTALAAIQGGEIPGGYAIPLDEGMRRIIAVLGRGEEVEYGFLGVGLSEHQPEQAEGIELGEVIEGSPAHKEAKLRRGDRILTVNGVPTKENDDLFLTLGTSLAGANVRLEVRRGNGLKQTVAVTLAKFFVPGKKIASSPGVRPWYRGLRVDFTSILALQQSRQPRIIPPGVYIAEVQANSPAALAQLKMGEIITHVNGRPVNTPASFYQAVATIQGPVEFTLATTSPRDAEKVVVK